MEYIVGATIGAHFRIQEPPIAPSLTVKLELLPSRYKTLSSNSSSSSNIEFNVGRQGWIADGDVNPRILGGGGLFNITLNHQNDHTLRWTVKKAHFDFVLAGLEPSTFGLPVSQIEATRSETLLI
jgi:hypothetical protein